MAKEKALFGEWATLKPADVNRILKPHGVRLVVKGSKAWGAKVNVTAQRLGADLAAEIARLRGELHTVLTPGQSLDGAVAAARRALATSGDGGTDG